MKRLLKLLNRQQGLALVIPWPRRGRLSMARYRRLAALLGGAIDAETWRLTPAGERPGPRLRCALRIDPNGNPIRKEWVELVHAYD